MRKFIIRNRRNHSEVKEMSETEFKSEFANDIKMAIEEFIRQENRNYNIHWKTPATESDFYFDIRTNFNNNSRSNYFIDRIL